MCDLRKPNFDFLQISVSFPLTSVVQHNLWEQRFKEKWCCFNKMANHFPILFLVLIDGVKLVHGTVENQRNGITSQFQRNIQFI